MIYHFIKTGIIGLFTTGTSCYLAAKLEQYIMKKINR